MRYTKKHTCRLIAPVLVAMLGLLVPAASELEAGSARALEVAPGAPTAKGAGAVLVPRRVRMIIGFVQTISV